MNPQRLLLLTYKGLPEYAVIYADSIEGLRNFSINEMMTSFCLLKTKDLTICEYLYRTAIKDYNMKIENREYKIYEPSEYMRQYVAFTDKNGDLMVWINSYCATKKDLSDYLFLVNVSDGGPCFFKLKLNLTKMRLEWIMVNGSA
jgi:hypothetical protein